jgi:hypothetical protein
MAITNIVDNRKRKYRFLKINAIVEAAWHDNSCQDADLIACPVDDDGPTYEERKHVTVEDAVAWTAAFLTPVTLYLYDEDSGIYTADIRGREHQDGPPCHPSAFWRAGRRIGTDMWEGVCSICGSPAPESSITQTQP